MNSEQQLKLIPTALDELLQPSAHEPDGAERLIAIVQRLSMARELPGVMAIVRRAARQLTDADGATFVLREGEACHYVDEDAVGPLWKGSRFPMSACISGWAMIHRKAVVIDDVYGDPRIPHDAYRPTFVRSLALVPIRVAAPIGAIGVYWARQHLASPREVRLLQALADSTSIAIENVQLYSALQAKVEESRGAVRARDEFLSVASHELRTPLTAVRLELQVLAELVRRRPEAADPVLMERVTRAVAGNRRLSALVDSLLDLSRITLGRLALEFAAFDLRDLAVEVTQRFAEQARQAGSPIEVHAPAASLTGRWDRHRLDQVLTNLLQNALKYGAGTPVELELSARLDAAVLAVRDHGIGIPAEHLPVLFERFSRAASPRNYGGLGLGLHISRLIVEAHGGTIEVESQVGQGACFRVVLPWEPPAPP